MPASTPSRMVFLGQRLDALDQRVARVDVDTGVFVGEGGRLEFALDFKALPLHAHP
jgi:hypothetical protein